MQRDTDKYFRIYTCIQTHETHRTNYTGPRLAEGWLIGFQNISVNTGSEKHIQGSEESAVIDVCEFSVAK